MDFLFFIFLIAFFAAVLKIAFWGWIVYHGVRTVAQAFNPYVVPQFNLLGQYIQQQQAAAAAAAEREARRRIAALPRSEQPAHRARLNDIVSKRLTLNPRTGEWEEH